MRLLHLIFSKLSTAKVALGAIAFVVGAWALCAFVAFRRLSPSWTQSLERLGQSGDAFGSINALFTGLGFAGLVYTIMLQIKDREEEREGRDEERRAIERQERERFLTARINAASAILTATHGITAGQNAENALFDRGNSYDRELQRVRQQIGFLMCEATLGFDKKWTPAVEKSSVHMYVDNLIMTMSFECSAAVENWKLKVGSEDQEKAFRKSYKAFLDIHVRYINEVTALLMQPTAYCRRIGNFMQGMLLEFHSIVKAVGQENVIDEAAVNAFFERAVKYHRDMAIELRPEQDPLEPETQ